MKKISFVITAWNEEGNVKELFSQIELAISNQKEYEFEYIFVDNGSTDNTLQECKNLKNLDNRIKILKLSRNFGFEGGITAGIEYSDSDAVVIMTANLQDDPKLINKFIQHWEEGYDMVYGIVNSRPGKSRARKFNSILFYKLINFLTKGLIPKDVSDYRLVDKKVIDAVKSMNEYNRFYRGFFAWVGFKSIGVEFDRQKRFSGESKALTFKVMSTAFKAIFSFTSIPLKISNYLAFLFSVLAIIILSVQTYNWIKFGVPFDGYGSIVGIVLLISSLMFLILGVIGEYISLIFDETKKRPVYIIEETI
jgi:glycosyltransferase involved in cell wall biosynthesis